MCKPLPQVWLAFQVLATTQLSPPLGIFSFQFSPPHGNSKFQLGRLHVNSVCSMMCSLVSASSASSLCFLALSRSLSGAVPTRSLAGRPLIIEVVTLGSQRFLWPHCKHVYRRLFSTFLASQLWLEPPIRPCERQDEVAASLPCCPVVQDPLLLIPQDMTLHTSLHCQFLRRPICDFRRLNNRYALP